MAVNVRKAQPGEAQAIFRLTRPYFAESMYCKHFTLCEATAIKTFSLALHCDEIVTYVAEDEAGLVGVAIIVFNDSFFEGFEGDIDFFYVSPKVRGTDTARMLVEACVKHADSMDGLNVLHCGCHSGIDDEGKNDALFTNLFRKYGFKVTGTNLHYIKGK